MTPTYQNIGFSEMQLAEQNGIGRFEDDYHRFLMEHGKIDRFDLHHQSDLFRQSPTSHLYDMCQCSESDLDLLITGLSLQQLQEVYTELQAIGKKFQVDIDLETELINGYGIKAAELFQPTQTVLGKSLQDVQILKKKTVVEILSQEA